MEKNTKKQGPAGRTQIKELPKAEKQLSKNEQKKVNGGGGMAGLLSGARRPQE
jgi:hypothetical protein